MLHWSPSELRASVKNWQDITAEPLRKGVGALRKKFEQNSWKVGEIMRQGCYAALHPGSANQARAIHESLTRIGCPRLPSVAGGQTEPAVFTAYFYQVADLLAREVRATFTALFEIGSAQSALLDGDAVNWATLQMKVLVADESHRIPLWTKDACDKQENDLSDAEESIYWRKWRAPCWFFMQPFASRPYDQSAAWQRMNEADSKHLLEVTEDRFNQRLITALDKVVDETHVRLAKEKPRTPPDYVILPETTGGRGLGKSKLLTAGSSPSPKADEWRQFYERFQSLADEEREQGAAQSDSFICAYFNYNERPEILHVRGRGPLVSALFGKSAEGKLNFETPPHGPFCLLDTPEHGLWMVSDGISESLHERFQTDAARAAVALGCPPNIDPVDFWLHRLLLDLRDKRSKLLFADDGKAGVIRRACEASLIFCLRLERSELESAGASALVQAESARTSVGFNQADNFRGAISKNTARIEQIERILSQPGVNVASASARRLIEEKQHLTLAITELKQELARLSALAVAIPAPPRPDVRTQEPASHKESLIRGILERKGWSLFDLAQEARVDPHTVNDYLKGKTTPYRSTRKKLADALGLPIEDLPR